MKHLKTIMLTLFCALTLGMGPFAAPGSAHANPLQVQVGVGVGIGIPLGGSHHRRRRRRRRSTVVIAAPIHVERHDNGKHKGQQKREDHGGDRH
jgi:hypothetical protein